MQSNNPTPRFTLDTLPKGFDVNQLSDAELKSLIAERRSRMSPEELAQYPPECLADPATLTDEQLQQALFFIRQLKEKEQPWAAYRVSRRTVWQAGEPAAERSWTFVHEQLLQARQQALACAQEQVQAAAGKKRLPLLDELTITLFEASGTTVRNQATIYQRALPTSVPEDLLTILVEKDVDEEEVVTLDQLLKTLYQLDAEERYYVQHGHPTGAGSDYLEIYTHLPHAIPYHAVHILADAHGEAKALITRYHQAHYNPPLEQPFLATRVPFDERRAKPQWLV